MEVDFSDWEWCVFEKMERFEKEFFRDLFDIDIYSVFWNSTSMIVNFSYEDGSNDTRVLGMTEWMKYYNRVKTDAQN